MSIRTSDEALAELMTGNWRYVNAVQSFPRQTAERRAETATGQHPFAIVVGCSDSRVPPEILFDQGLGDLFVIRVAGNVVDAAAMGSIEYAVEHLNVPLLIVLGHRNCGAVAATVKGGDAPGCIKSLAEAIQPAVEQARSRPGDLLDNAVKANVDRVARQLESAAPILDKAVREDRLRIVRVIYDLESGSVELLQ